MNDRSPLLDPLDDRLRQVEHPQRLTRPRQRRADHPGHVRRGQRLVLRHDRPRRPRELHGLGLALVEVLGELHRQRLAPRDVGHDREAPVLAHALGLVEQLHRGEAAAAREQLVGLVVVPGGADERRVQQAALLDRHGEVVDVGQRPDAHVHHRADLAQRRGHERVRAVREIGERRLAEVLGP
nr:hypothetical protein [Conexibacter sp. W3-3-2]